MRLQFGLILAALFSASSGLAQTPAGGAQQKPPAQHEPAVPAAPAQPAAEANQAAPTAEKLDPAKEAAIRHLLDITEGASMGEGVTSGITQHVYEVMRHAISPDHVQKFMETFTQKFNAIAPSSAITDAGIPIYAQNFSMEDIQGLIQFYESPLGEAVGENNARGGPGMAVGGPTDGSESGACNSVGDERRVRGTEEIAAAGSFQTSGGPHACHCPRDTGRSHARASTSKSSRSGCSSGAWFGTGTEACSGPAATIMRTGAECLSGAALIHREGAQ